MNLNNELANIRKQVSPDGLTNKCGVPACKVHLTDIPRERVVIDVQKEFNTREDKGKRCDGLLFYENSSKNTLVAVPIELKSGKASVSQVTAQLKCGLEFAATLVQDLKEPSYVPIVFIKRGMKRPNPKQKLTIEFKGKTLTVLRGRCGRERNLANALSNAGYL